jgi:hypothetical protein
MMKKFVLVFAVMVAVFVSSNAVFAHPQFPKDCYVSGGEVGISGGMPHAILKVKCPPPKN